jgi:hypothetical protein
MEENFLNPPRRKLPAEFKKAKKPIPEPITNKIAKAILCWMLICGVLSGLFYLSDVSYATSGAVTHGAVWFPAASIWAVIIGFNIAWAYVVYHDAKHRGRKEVAWATAFVIFGAFLAGIFYLLTWPSSTKKGGHMEFISLYDVRMTYQKMPQFFEHINVGEEILYQEEELRFINKVIPTELQDKEFPRENTEPLWFGLAAEGLRRVTRSYIASEDFASAQESCIKLLEFPTSTKDDWLLLADILTEQNDSEKAKLILEEAEKL